MSSKLAQKKGGIGGANPGATGHGEDEGLRELLGSGLPDSWGIVCLKQLGLAGLPPARLEFVVVAENTVFVLQRRHFSGPLELAAHRRLESD